MEENGVLGPSRVIHLGRTHFHCIQFCSDKGGRGVKNRVIGVIQTVEFARTGGEREGKGEWRDKPYPSLSIVKCATMGDSYSASVSFNWGLLLSK